MNIQKKILGLCVLLVVLVSGSLIALLFSAEAKMRTEALELRNSIQNLESDLGNKLNHLMISELQNSAKTLWRLCNATEKKVQIQLAGQFDLAQSELSKLGKISLGSGSLHWTCVNQFSGEKSEINLPPIYAGSSLLGNPLEINKSDHVVDFVNNATKVHCTIFQRMNDDGDMLRISTSIINSNGILAKGTFIPRRNPDGTENIVIMTALRGETYRDRAFVVNDWHNTVYQPIFDIRGKLVGMLSVGSSVEESYRSMREALTKVVVGKTGYVWVIQGSGNQRGTYVVSKDGIRDGENIWETQDASGRKFIQAFIGEAMKNTRDGNSIIDRYPWKNPDEFDIRMKIAAVTYFEPLDWAIGVSIYEDEFLESGKYLRAAFEKNMTTIDGMVGSIKSLINWVLGIGIGVVLFGFLLAHFFSQGISRPIIQLAARVEKFEVGHLEFPVFEKRSEEIGILENAFSKMVESLRAAIVSIKANEERYRTLVENLAIGIIRTTLDGKILAANYAAVVMFGFDNLESLLETNIGGMYQNSEDGKNLLKVLLEHDFLRNFEIRLKRKKDGSPFIGSYTGKVSRNKQEEILWVDAIIEDITDRVEMEQRLRHMEKMDAIGQLAGGVAHDFNNMLGGISGLTELSLLKIPPDTPVRKNLLKVLEAAKRASELTQKLLAFSRKGKVFSTALCIHDPIHAAIVLLKHSLDKRIRIETRFEATQSQIIGETALLQNAVLNLAVNARDAMPEGGILSFRTANVTLDEEFCKNQASALSPGSYVEIDVSDTGIGIPAENINRIFEPFFTTKPVGKGTGLGLAAVYGTVKEHKGIIRVYSEIGRGTIFKMYFPTNSSLPCMEIADDKPLILGHGRILVIDDEPIIRDMAKQMLEKMGYEVLLAEDGEKGLEIYRKEKETIALVLLDLVMPKMNGRQTFIALKEMEPQVKILLSSGFNPDDSLEDLFSQETMGFIQKPYLQSELNRKISEVLKKTKE